MRSCSRTRGGPRCRFLADGEQAAVGAVGIGFQGWQGRRMGAQEGVLSGRCTPGRGAQLMGALGSCSSQAEWEREGELAPFLLPLSRPCGSSLVGGVSLRPLPARREPPPR